MPAKLPESGNFTEKQRIWMMATMVLVPIIILLSIHDKTQPNVLSHKESLFPKIEEVTLVRGNDPKKNKIKLPFYANGKPNEILQFHITLNYSEGKSSIFWLTPDDCANSIRVNEVDVELKDEALKHRCSWDHGFRLDLGPYLHTGENKIDIIIMNKQGRTGLAFDSIVK